MGQRLQRFGQFAAQVSADEPLGNHPPVHAVRVVQGLAAVTAVNALHPLGRVLEIDQRVGPLKHFQLLRIPGRHRVVRDIEQLPAVLAVAVAPNPGFTGQANA